MITWMNPQQYQHYIAHTAPPPGWKGTWPPTAPAGYPGPPPPPQGMKVDPKMWYQGQWQFNPMYRSVASAQAQAWAPHPIWQHGADFNPYKRIPNPPSEAYWQTKLSDNPLGLHNMEIRCEDPHTQATQTKALPQTPWIWAPQLSESPERHDQPQDLHNTYGVRGAQGAHTSQQHPQQLQSMERRESSSSMPCHPLTDGQMAILRSKREWGVEDQRNNHTRRAKVEASGGPDAWRKDYHQRWEQVKAFWDLSRIDWNITESQMYFLHEEMEKEQNLARSHQRRANPSQDLVSSAQQQQQQPHPRSAAPSSSTTQPTQMNTAPASYRPGTLQDQQARAYEERRPVASTPDHRATHDANVSERYEPDDGVFSSKEQLQPTFSPGIVRTPHHYSSASGATAAAQSSASTPVRTSLDRERPQLSPRTHGPIYGPSTPRNVTPSRSRNDSAQYDTPMRQSSTSSHSRSSTNSSSIASLNTFSEEPDAALLSPLVPLGAAVLDRPGSERSGPESRSGRELTRSQTVPTLASTGAFSPIPEERSPPTASRTPRPSPHVPPSSYPSHFRADAATPTPSSRRSPGDVRILGRAHTMPNFDTSPSQPHTRSTSSSRIASPVSSPSHHPRPRSPSTQSTSRSRRPSRSPLRNPLPSPPMPSNYSANTWSSEKAMSSLTLNGTSRAYSHPQPESQPREQSQARSQSYPPALSQSQHSSRPSQSGHSGHSPAASYSSRPTAVSTASSSASSAARAAAMARQESSDRERERERQRERERIPVRYGYWNKRGDHLWFADDRDPGEDRTFIVYAPPSQANPLELHDYPAPTQGFMNHHGDLVKYDPNIPELLASLPRHGEPPRMPYNSFIKYLND